jgi:myo-inositol 2-dehydrogenase/D-chiro-inositol 1-dehydrogenase
MAHAKKVVTVGVIGCGQVAEGRHLPALRNLADVRVRAVADVDRARVQRMGDQFGIERRYEGAAALLADPEIDAVAVCVPASLHVEVALAALDAGKHVLIEKPLALSLDDAERLSRRARAFSGKVMMGFNMRWHRLVRRARAMIMQGRLGPLELMRTSFTSHHETLGEWRTRRELGGGALFEIAVHHFDLWRFLLGTEVEEIVAVSRSGQWDDETTTVMARLANGIPVASVFSERTSETNELEVYGRGGRVRVSCYHFDGMEFVPPSRFPGAMGTRLRHAVRALKEVPTGLRWMRRGGDFFASYEAEWRHFTDAIRRDTPVECTVEDGQRALEVCLAAMASAARGAPVKIGEAPRDVAQAVGLAPARGDDTRAGGPGERRGRT